RAARARCRGRPTRLRRPRAGRAGPVASGRGRRVAAWRHDAVRRSLRNDDHAPVNRRDVLEIALAAALLAAAAAANSAGATPVLAFLVAAAAIAMLARLIGSATEQLGSRVGSSAAGVVQSALGNLPELFISLFALHRGLVRVVQSALVGSVIANG